MDDEEFDRMFESIKRLPPKPNPTEITPADKTALRARLDLVILECMPEEMNLEDMMQVSKAAFGVIVWHWQNWIKEGNP